MITVTIAAHCTYAYLKFERIRKVAAATFRLYHAIVRALFFVAKKLQIMTTI